MDLAKGIGRCAKFEKSVPDCLDAKQTAYGAATALVQLMASYVAKVEDSDFSTAMLEGMQLLDEDAMRQIISKCL